MKAFYQLDSNTFAFGAVGNTLPPTIKSGQVEQVCLTFINGGGATLLAGGATLLLTLKTAKAATTLLASASAFTLSGNVYTLWLSLNNDACKALPEGTLVLAELVITDSNGDHVSDDVWLKISRRSYTGGEAAPSDSTAAARAAWLAAYVLPALNGGVTITSDPVTGSIGLSASAGGVVDAAITAIRIGADGSLEVVTASHTFYVPLYTR